MKRGQHHRQNHEKEASTIYKTKDNPKGQQQRDNRTIEKEQRQTIESEGETIGITMNTKAKP